MAIFELQAFVTDHNNVLEDILSENIDNSRKFEACMNTMATRLATVFASLNVCMYVCMLFEFHYHMY